MHRQHGERTKLLGSEKAGDEYGVFVYRQKVYVLSATSSKYLAVVSKVEVVDEH